MPLTTCLEVEAEGSVVLSSGADLSTEQQTKGADPRTGTLKGVLCRLPLVPPPVLAGRAVLPWLRVPWFSCPVLAGSCPCFLFPLLACGSFLLFSLFSGDVPSTVPFFWPRASHSKSQREGRRVKRKGTDPSTGTGHRPKKRLFQMFHFTQYFLSCSQLCTRRSCITADDWALRCVGDVFAQYLVTGHFRLL